ncbi:transmembrane O-methyltransferase-like [Eucyclogobius newberryi]|uniref:transmembrane O-methyltransferase-like n=1 Tax=Eucyclogobius newberryi TaxID=166745 RepID=UPI003B59DBAD
MWLLAVSASLLPAVLLLSKHYRLKVVTLCRRAQAWTLWLVRQEVCTQSIHAFVFCQSTHGRVDSVLQTYDLYHSMFPSLCIGPHIGAQLDEVVRRVRPSLALELGTHCGYSSVRVLRLLPPGGRLITVEQDPQTADYGEELILVAGFKPHQFEVLVSSSRDVAALLPGRVRSHEEGFSLVVMDHDPAQYLTDLKALEREGLLRSGGCSIVLIHRKRGAGREIKEHILSRRHCYCISAETRFMMEVSYRNGG